MVLIRIATVLALAGCHQSLFDAKGGDDVHPDGPTTIPSMCPAGCLADAGGDFMGSGPWRYLEDDRHHVWTAMTAGADGMTGAIAGNAITSCAKRSAAACDVLPDALLVSSAGFSAADDPAIELAIKKSQNVRIDLGAYVASGASQTIRLYRNSREDSLFTGTAQPGTPLSTSVTLDVLDGDRILVAVAPSAAGAADVGIQLFMSPASIDFPKSCLMALTFAPRTSTTVHDSCNMAELMSVHYAGGTSSVLNVAAPYPELGSGASIAGGDLFKAAALLDRTGDTTTQLWLKQNTIVDDSAGWFYSDVDNDGGIGIALGTSGGAPTVGAFTGVGAITTGFTGSYPGDHGWHFVRVVYTAGTLSLCVDGKNEGSMTLPPLATTLPAMLGQNQDYTPLGAYVDGAVDDVRVLRGALPCE